MSAARTDAIAARKSRIARLVGLYAVTPDVDDTATLARNVEAAIGGGAAAIQYRNKRADATLRRDQAHAISRIAARAQTLFIVNDDAALAAAVDADGVHVGEDDGAIAVARETVGNDRLVGASCYDDIERAYAAVDAGADYVALGSFFDSAVKPAARRASIDVLRRAATLGVPVVAIGGITAANAPALIVAGATAVAVITDVFGSGDPVSITRAAAAIVRACTFERGLVSTSR